MNRFIPARATEGSILIHNTITVPKLHRTPISGYEFLNCTDHDRFPIALLFLVTDKYGFFFLMDRILLCISKEQQMFNAFLVFLSFNVSRSKTLLQEWKNSTNWSAFLKSNTVYSHTCSIVINLQKYLHLINGLIYGYLNGYRAGRFIAGRLLLIL